MSAPTVQKIGRRGERLAARYLRRAGYRVIAKNRHYGKNELDLIVKDKQNIVFVEVKTRTVTDKATTKRPADAVNLDKRKRTVAAALAHLRAHPCALCPRFDVVEVYLDRARRLKPLRIHHIPDAFSASGRTKH